MFLNSQFSLVVEIVEGKFSSKIVDDRDIVCLTAHISKPEVVGDPFKKKINVIKKGKENFIVLNR